MKKQEFCIPLMEGGVQLHVIIVTKTKQEAAKMLGVSLYYLNNYGNCYEPKTELAIKNMYQRFAYYDSGWLMEKIPDLYRKVVPYHVLANYISEVNRNKYDKMFKRNQ